jgi:excisionase family DNA binding protein
VAAAVAPASVAARLLDVDAAAAYLGVSPWTVRDLEAAGTLKRVRVPLRGGELRKLLFDRADLDRLIEAWKI